MFFKRRTTFSFLTALLALAAFILLAWVTWSQFWVEAIVEKNVEKIADASGADSEPLKAALEDNVGQNKHDESDPGAFRGFVNYGLFRGCKRFNHGFGGREPSCFSIYKEHGDVYATWLVVVVIVLIFIALIFALIATVFGLVNTLAVPIEAIYGPPGLYLWNGLAAGASIIAVIIYLLLYGTAMKEEILNEEDLEMPNYFQTIRTELGLAFYLALVACLLLLVNFVFVALAQYSHDPDAFKSKKKKRRDENYNTASRSDLGSGMIY